MYGQMRGVRRASSGAASFIRNSASPALLVQNTHASGDAVSVLDASGTQFVKIGRYSGGRSALAFGDISGVLNPSVLFWINEVKTDHGSGFETSVSTVTNSVDIGASLFVSSVGNTGAVSHGRAIEGHHFRLPGSSAGENYIAELGRHCAVANALAANDVGVRISNEHTIWDPPISSGSQGGYGVLVRGEDTWQYGYGLLDAAEAMLWRVNGTTGEVTSGNLLPRTNGTYTVGGSGLNWLVVTGNFVSLTSNGAANAPALTNATFSTTGLFWNAGAADNLGITVAAAEVVRLTSGGLLDFRPAAATVALGGGAAPTVGTIGGSGPAVAGQNSWLKVKIGGTDSYIPVWR